MKIAIGADHGGFELKNQLVEWLRASGHEVIDVGAHTYVKTDDYPDFAVLVGEALQSGKAERGIVICTSGVGITVAANKMEGIRACLCHDVFSARQGVEDDDMNVLSLGAAIIGVALAKELVKAFLAASFQPEERFLRRRSKIMALEKARQD